MKISRLSSLILGLVIAAFSFGYMNPSLAGKPDANGCHDHQEDCGGDPPGGPGDGKATFSVSVSGLTSGDSLPDHPWRTTSKHGIGESDPHEDAPALVNFNASYFAVEILDGDNCFPANGMTTDTVREASIRERRGAMESMFWFRGRTKDDSEDVTYILHMDGELTTVGNFPPAPLDAPSMMAMGNWRINVANGQSEVEPFACVESSGAFGSPVFIDVTPQP